MAENANVGLETRIQTHTLSHLIKSNLTPTTRPRWQRALRATGPNVNLVLFMKDTKRFFYGQNLSTIL